MITLRLISIFVLSTLCLPGSNAQTNKGSNKPDKGEVYFIPTLHQLHVSNQRYNYDTLRAVIARLHPDLIAVEIRPEDMHGDSLYLARNYPYEMRMAGKWFPGTPIAGFDWLGKNIEGKPIPAGYWKTMEVKVLQDELDKDSVYSKKTIPCGQIMENRFSFLQQCSLEELLKGNDSERVRQYYKCLRDAFRGSKYLRISEFYEQRDKAILSNLKKIIAQNQGKRIVILTGGDHYALLKNKLKTQPVQ